MTFIIERRALSFPAWVRGRYPTAVRQLEKMNDDRSEFWDFVWKCIEHAEAARAWQRASAAGHIDEHEAARQQDSEYLGSREPIIQALLLVADDIEKYPYRTAFSLVSALLSIKKEDGIQRLITATSNAQGVNPFGRGPGTVPDIVRRLLRHYANQLRTKPLAKSGPFLHRTAFGPLQYSNYSPG